MNVTEPKIEHRPAQEYFGIRVQIPHMELGAVAPRLFDEMFEWVGKHGLTPAAAPFIRYHVINMADKLDIEFGIPVATANERLEDGRVSKGIIPGGQYAYIVYTGDYTGLMEANRVLVDWAKAKFIAWDNWDTDEGDNFRSRLENYLTDPAAEPDSSKWQTEVAIKLADT